VSAIFGIVNREGAPVTPETLNILRAGNADWGRDGGGALCSGPAGLGLTFNLNTPEAKFECLPSVDPAGNMFTAAGRVDNRAELSYELSIGAEVSGLADGTLIHRAWLRWGERCAERILGDWAFAAWNPFTRRLCLVRDHSGNTAVYYYADSRFFAFSSSQSALLRIGLPQIEMDELYLAEVLVSWRGHRAERTIRKQLNRLPPAHFLMLTPGVLETTRYWRLEDTPELLLPNRKDYVPAFLEVFDRAVADCLRGEDPTAAMLSGGLDSSSVAVTAARHLRRAGQRLTAFTSVPRFEFSAYSGSGFGDELPFANAIAAAAGNIDVETVDAAGLSPIAAIRRTLEFALEPKHGAGNMFWILELCRIAAAKGSRVLLSGFMGNGSISWTGNAFSQPLLDRIGFLGWRPWLRAELRRRTPPPILNALLRHRREPGWSETAINPDFARRLDLTARYLDSAGELPSPSAMLRHWIIGPGESFAGAAQAELGAATGLEIRDPTVDTRVLTFCFSVPDRIFIDPQTRVDRWLIREAMKDRLPHTVRLNRRRGLQAADLVPRLRGSSEELERVLEEIEGGPAAEYVCIPALRAAWGTVRTQDNPGAHRLAVSVLTRGIMAGLFVNGFGTKW
jgi:asparagine synthase (glutamine-hydrolysing)